MKKTLVLYWPEGGAVDRCAHKIFSALTPENADIFNLEEIDTAIFENYSTIIAGGSTVGAETWEEVSANNEWNLFLKKCKESGLSLKGKNIAVFGLGDQVLYPNHFVDDMAHILNDFTEFGANAIGSWSAEGYRFTASKAVKDGMFIGLALDEVNDSEHTDSRISCWLKQMENTLV